MKVNSKIFRAYDIRGIYPQEVNGRIAYLIGRAFVKFLNKKNLRIVIGRDQRPSSLILHRKLTEGIIDQGGNVIDIGLSTSPMCYFGIANYRFDGGIEITASHLPKEYNGFKLLREKAKFIGQNTGLRKIEKIVQRIEKEKIKKSKDKIQKKKIIDDYLKFNLKEFRLEKFEKLRVVVDTGKAVSQILIPPLSKILPIKIYNINPSRPLNPLEKGALKILQKEVKLKNADLGVAFDGDGDRVIFVSEKGEILPGDLITALLAKFILKENPGQTILYDITSSRIVPEIIKKCGGKAIISRTGHTFVAEKMRENDALFGGEFSGHYYHQSYHFVEAPLFVFLKILDIISTENQPFSKLILPFKKYYNSGQINFKTKKPEKSLEKIEKQHRSRGGKILKIDGLRVDFEDFWFLVRPSQTEPILRLTVEAKTKKLLEEKTKELTRLIEGFK